MARVSNASRSLLQRAREVNREIARVCAAVAGELRTPAGKCCRAALGDRLRELEALRPKLRRLRRDIQSTLADGPGNDAPARQSNLAPGERVALRRVLGGLNLGLRKWAPVIACLRQQASGPPLALYAGRASRRDIDAAQLAVSDEVFLILHRIANPADQHELARAHGCYPDIPMRPSEFLEHAHAAYRVAIAQRRAVPVRFLDVGCGGGVKVLLAAGFFGRADGLEYDPAYARAARGLFSAAGADSCTVIEGDALSFGNYRDYDVVYFFKPMSDPEKLAALEERVVSGVRPGTILVAPYHHFLGRSSELGCARVVGSIYLASTPQAAADDVRAAAERVGAARPRRARAPADCGFWQPVVDAARANGFEPFEEELTAVSRR
ncbi:MAG: class I SAM-dependent methyltransferase [Paracoccaceae bacterium]